MNNKYTSCLQVTNSLAIPFSEIELLPIRAQGAGGQHVNKVATAIHLRFDILRSSLPASCKERLLNAKDDRITTDGIIVIKAQQYKSQEQNKMAALERLAQLIQRVNTVSKKRRKTKPTRGSVKKRLDKKTLRGNVKKLRKAL